MEEFVECDYLRNAYRYAELFSDDPLTKNGAVLVGVDGRIIGVGANTLPENVEKTPERLERPTKYRFMEHAERNAIYHAAVIGASTLGSTLGSTMYCFWITCADCARAIIQAGVKRVVGHKQFCDIAKSDRWDESIEAGFAMLKEAGVTVDFYDGPIGDVTAYYDGKVWKP
jgi:dCMP deaminase